MVSDALARVIATALEAGTALNEERVRQIVREELAAVGRGPLTPAWTTPPRGAQACGVGVRRVRALIAAGRVQTRTRNLDPSSAKQIKTEINIASLEAALSGEQKPEAPVVDAASWAARRAAKKVGG